MYFKLYKVLEIARFAAIGKMYGCITTGSCRSKLRSRERLPVQILLSKKLSNDQHKYYPV